MLFLQQRLIVLVLNNLLKNLLDLFLIVDEKKITGYRLEGNQCIRLVEDVPIPQQVINAVPPIGTVVTTAGIAAVATTSALLAKTFC